MADLAVGLVGGSEQAPLFRRVLIPLDDGVDLSGDLWLPETEGSWPTIFSYTPYQKDAFAAVEHEASTRYFVLNGYAVLIVDMRGVGHSEGITSGAFDPREGRDASQVIGWAATQPWSDGNIGMWGSSYECLTAFAAAAQRPPALKAIVGLQGLFDGYRDAAYPGGARNCLGMVGAWGGLMLALQLLPPVWQDPDGRWRRIWNQRLAEAEPFMLPWHQHQTFDEYWRDRVLPVEKIEVPSFLIGSWRDLFPDAMCRVYERIRAPKKLWMGPWLHAMPDTASFDPIDYLPEVLRWWDRWLLGRETGIDSEPPVSLYVQESGWRLEQEWPLARSTSERFYLTSAGLSDVVQNEVCWLSHTADPTVGAAAGLWEPLAIGVGLPLDQGEDDLRSLTFTTDPVLEDLEITGCPIAHLRVRVLKGADALISVKLTALDQSGRSALITRGVLKASHRAGDAHASDVTAGQELGMEIALAPTSYRVARGCRIRVSLAGADFPRYWPLAENSAIEVCVGGPGSSSIDVPIAPAEQPCEGRLPAPGPGMTAESSPLVLQQKPIWTVERDLAASAVRVSTGEELTCLTDQRQGTMAMKHVATASVSRDRPGGAHVVTRTEIRLRTRLDQEVLIESASDVGQHGATLYGHVRVDDQEVFQQTWRA